MPGPRHPAAAAQPRRRFTSQRRRELREGAKAENEQLQMATGTSLADPGRAAAVGWLDLRATGLENRHGQEPQAAKAGNPALVRGEGNSWR